MAEIKTLQTVCVEIKYFNECSTLTSSIIQLFTSVPVVRTAVMLGKRLKIASYSLVTKMCACLKNIYLDMHKSRGGKMENHTRVIASLRNIFTSLMACQAHVNGIHFILDELKNNEHLQGTEIAVH